MSKKLKFFVSVTVISLLLILGVSIAFANTGGSFSGGGQIHEAPADAKRPEWKVISFGGSVEGSGSPVGEWQVNFHNVGVDALDKSTFHTTDIRVVNYYPGNSGTCNSALNFTAYGEWNQDPGYKLIFRAGDLASPGFFDTVRIELYAPDGSMFYDTNVNWRGEFANESSCVGGGRTGLDAGNVTIVMPE